MEKWKQIPGYEGVYEVSDRGRIKSVGRYKHPRKDRSAYWQNERILSQYKQKNGYMMVCLAKDGTNRTFSVHRLVLRSFVGEPEAKYEACHNNGKRDDNNLENLRWDTRVNNFKDRDWHGKTACGTKNGWAKLDDEKVNKILADARPNRQIAKDYGVSSVTIDRIKSRLTWAHIKADFVVPTDRNRRTGMVGQNNHSAKLAPEKVKAILSDTRTNTQIAKDYGVSRTAVYLIKTRRKWAHV